MIRPESGSANLMLSGLVSFGLPTESAFSLQKYAGGFVTAGSRSTS
jgi:hypothetical protein